MFNPEKWPTVENKKTEKEARLKEIEKEVDGLRDALGMPVDPKIKDAVVGLNAWGLPCTASCEGHVEKISAPWVEIEAFGRPEETFENENKIFQEVADKYNIPVEEVRRDIHHEAWIEAAKKGAQNDKTEEYKRWNEKNKELMKKAEGLLKEFYKDRRVEPSVKLQTEEEAEGYRIHNGGEDYNPDAVLEGKKELSEEEKRALALRLVEYQREMNEFAKFLKDKYLKG